MTYREELIQVAAVAIAMVQDHDDGTTDLVETLNSVIREVQVERYMQEDKWGPQHHTPAEWLAILMEEAGEAAQAALKTLIFPAEEAAAALEGEATP